MQIKIAPIPVEVIDKVILRGTGYWNITDAINTFYDKKTAEKELKIYNNKDIKNCKKIYYDRFLKVLKDLLYSRRALETLKSKYNLTNHKILIYRTETGNYKFYIEIHKDIKIGNVKSRDTLTNTVDEEYLDDEDEE